MGVVDEFKNGSPFALNSTQFEFGGYGTGPHSICVEATHNCKGLDGSVG